jgi:hypothetical protein
MAAVATAPRLSPACCQSAVPSCKVKLDPTSEPARAGIGQFDGGQMFDHWPETYLALPFDLG